MFGLAASTVLVLIIIPAAYAALSDVGLAPEPWHDPDAAYAALSDVGLAPEPWHDPDAPSRAHRPEGQ